MLPWFRRYAVTLALCLQLPLLGVLKLGQHGADGSAAECNHIAYPASVLPGAGPLTIAFFADVHNHAALFNKAVEEVEKAKPDLIIFGGDFVLADQRFMRTRWAVKGFERLTRVAPVFAVLGNQDYEKLEQLERVLNSAGVRLLRNEAVDWQTPSGATLRIIGLGDWNEGDERPQDCMSRQKTEGQPVLLLSHDPESRWLLRGYAWDMMLSGHTHGGQIGIPFLNRCLSFRSSMPAGDFSFEGDRRVFVTRGLGSIWGMRFFCPPEVNIIRIGLPPESSCPKGVCGEE